MKVLVLRSPCCHWNLVDVDYPQRGAAQTPITHPANPTKDINPHWTVSGRRVKVRRGVDVSTYERRDPQGFNMITWTFRCPRCERPYSVSDKRIHWLWLDNMHNPRRVVFAVLDRDG
jgi:hypothetical protein